MTSTIKKTVFRLDESLCTGCGKCTKACLTKIMLKELGSVQVYEYEGADIKELDGFEIEGEISYTRLYQTDKIEKTCIMKLVMP